MDERILNSTKEELERLQQMDINTQLDGVWFYDTCNTLEKLEKNKVLQTIILFQSKSCNSKFK
ncbi:MAG: hypothetical protein Ct9H300mP9_4890 [Candidatus Neomarinimicrobiota bacterium]|nr:MAG: hypothetical protein Ct9H300mP9_4890 [Candidatus Neomarinimicrobiota bacterium]